MRFADFSLDVVRDVVGRQGRAFYANDVSEDAAMLARHRPSSEEVRTYRRMVGRYLYMHRRELGLVLTHHQMRGRGRLWEHSIA